MCGRLTPPPHAYPPAPSPSLSPSQRYVPDRIDLTLNSPCRPPTKISTIPIKMNPRDLPDPVRGVQSELESAEAVL